MERKNKRDEDAEDDGAADEDESEADDEEEEGGSGTSAGFDADKAKEQEANHLTRQATKSLIAPSGEQQRLQRQNTEQRVLYKRTRRLAKRSTSRPVLHCT